MKSILNTELEIDAIMQSIAMDEDHNPILVGNIADASNNSLTDLLADLQIEFAKKAAPKKSKNDDDDGDIDDDEEDFDEDDFDDDDFESDDFEVDPDFEEFDLPKAKKGKTTGKKDMDDDFDDDFGDLNIFDDEEDFDDDF